MGERIEIKEIEDPVEERGVVEDERFLVEVVEDGRVPAVILHDRY
jgi:hypothetical protein